MNRNSNFVIVVIVALLIIGLIYWIFNMNSNGDVVTTIPTNTPMATTTDVVSSTATSTVMGEYVCLPHRDTSGPTTLECAFGLKADNGDYYALDTSLIGGMTALDIFETGDRVKVTGRLGTTTPQQMNIYNIEGSIRVNTIEEQ